MVKEALQVAIQSLPDKAKVLDVGCLEYFIVRVSHSLGRNDLVHSGVDYIDRSQTAPEGFTFRLADLSKERLPFPDDSFDLVVASHVIEHLPNPVEFTSDLIRVAKPGGLIYLEAPSERSLWLPSMPFQHDKFFSLNFYDDPTHQLRPWPPQALFRLFKYLECDIQRSGYYYSVKIRMLLPFYLLRALLTKNGGALEYYLWSAVGWAAYCLGEKPKSLHGSPQFNYYIPAR